MHDVAVNPFVALAYLVAGVCFIIDLTFLGGRERLSRYPQFSLIEY